MPKANGRVGTCRRKFLTATFHSKAHAKAAASRVRRQAGHRVDWFRCRVCGCWHIGSPETKLPLLEAFAVALEQLAHELSREPQKAA